MQPASGYGDQPSEGSWESFYERIRSAMFMFSGTSDILVSETWVSTAYAALDDTIEAYHWSALGSTHVPTPNSETAELAVPWFRWKLLDDSSACQSFKSLRGNGWDVVREQNEAPCE
jgi:hypothetical protein